MIPSNYFNKMRHDLRTYLNHIMGYGDILIAEAREYGKTEFIPAIEQILLKAEQLRRVIQFHFDIDDPSENLSAAQDIRKALFSPLMQLISDSRRMLGQFRTVAPQFLRDIEQLLAEANHMHELIESELIDIELMQLANDQVQHDTPELLPESLTIHSDDSIQGQMARIPARVLVIDDNIVYHRLIRRHLEALGHKVTCLDNAASALEFLETNPVDIIILDVLIPGVPGSNILKTIKQNQKLSDIPVIMMSALAESASIAQCIRLGAEDYLMKDFDPVILKARLDTCMEKKILQQQQKMYMNALLESQRALATELSDAADYVVSLLPPPLDHKIQAGLSLIPSAQLGGDFCNYHWLDAENLCMYLLDVCGHGVKASLLAVSISNLIVNKGIPEVNFRSPGEVLNSINVVFQRSSTHPFLFCLWYGVYNTTTRQLTYASGGSPPACIIAKQNPAQVQELGCGDLVLGAAEEYEYLESTATCEPGDRLFVYSDGLYEISRPDGTLLGLSEFQNLLPLLNEEPTKNIDNLIHSVLSLTKNSQFQDDISIIALEF